MEWTCPVCRGIVSSKQPFWTETTGRRRRHFDTERCVRLYIVRGFSRFARKGTQYDVDGQLVTNFLMNHFTRFSEAGSEVIVMRSETKTLDDVVDEMNRILESGQIELRIKRTLWEQKDRPGLEQFKADVWNTVKDFEDCLKGTKFTGLSEYERARRCREIKIALINMVSTFSDEGEFRAIFGCPRRVETKDVGVRKDRLYAKTPRGRRSLRRRKSLAAQLLR